MSIPCAKMLIIDDEEGIREMLSVYFEASGFQVNTAPNGDEALEMVKGDPDYDVILLDVVMPGMSGVAALGALREAGISTPVIMMTAHGMLHKRLEAIDLGATDLVLKPFDIDELEEHVEKVLH